ncbi:AMP-binding protein [Nitratireductor sp. ZSWI3]|uniref:AMP-binding protein n=1 Tax=Nitratireductor sp. ZSWI3 TaxID=2966359 RepID=UPI00214F64DE|nr:AMP-binding protein [Nitratireductor sp. ZSWI3]MCR4265276.1 AMP-binding protein [Nitratireductor sp. ZSWI3]
MAPRLDDLLAPSRRNGGALFHQPDGGTADAAAFDALTAGAEAWLRGRGVGAGDRIALWMVNRLEWLAVLFACARIGAAVAVVNTRYRASELEHILRSSGASLLILEPDFGRIDFLSILRDLKGSDLPELEEIALFGAQAVPEAIIGRSVVAAVFDPTEGSGPDRESDPDAPLIFFTTSGTTSAPKLVTHPQRTLALHAQRCATAYGFNEPGAAFFAAMPFCGVFGLNAALAAVAAGAPMHLAPMFEAGEAARRIEEHRITHVFGSDEMFRRLLEAGEAVLASARCCGYAAFTPGLSETMLAAAKAGVPIRGLYGSSEVCALFAIQDRDAPPEQRIQGGGRPASADAEVRVRDPESGRLLPAGQTGALEIRSPTNFAGYFRNPEATAKAVDEEGFFRSGDMGFVRGDGTFVYLARMGDAIRLSGFLTDPAEIEEVLKRLPGVRDAQVVAVAHQGQSRPVAFVIPAALEPFDEERVIAEARAQLAAYKVPLHVWPVEAYPTTDSANGLKIQRARLRAMAEERMRKVTA